MHQISSKRKPCQQREVITSDILMFEAPQHVQGDSALDWSAPTQGCTGQSVAARPSGMTWARYITYITWPLFTFVV